MRTQKSADITGGCFLVLLGLFTLFAASQITGGLEERLPPRTLPYTVGVIILISGALLAIRSWRFHGEDPVIKWPNRSGTVRVLITLVSLGIYLALMEPLGLPLSTFLYVSFTVWYLGKYRIWYPLLIGFLSGSISYLVFIYLLELSFPAGPFLTP
ncbi:MAG TPA: tripartite tricarboxylate transporter TctB family protein [Thermodesulfobacteriota bacterium]|nr:tripartite tricarboxylate transporter TctB family protein [Thermodesulfobacteriota bacterium]